MVDNNDVSEFRLLASVESYFSAKPLTKIYFVYSQEIRAHQAHQGVQ